MIGIPVLGRSFRTGSTVYGTPTPASDIDVVVCVEDDIIETLFEADSLHQFIEAEEYNDGSISIRVGKLNLILIESEGEFERWRTATEKLKKVRPVSKHDAKRFFQTFVDGMQDDATLPAPTASATDKPADR